MGKIRKFEDIEAWKEACNLAEMVYKMTRLDKFSKDYGLKGQIQRASVSNEVLGKCVYVSNLLGKFIQYLKKYSNR